MSARRESFIRRYSEAVAIFLEAWEKLEALGEEYTARDYATNLKGADFDVVLPEVTKAEFTAAVTTMGAVDTLLQSNSNAINLYRVKADRG